MATSTVLLHIVIGIQVVLIASLATTSNPQVSKYSDATISQHQTNGIMRREQPQKGDQHIGKETVVAKTGSASNKHQREADNDDDGESEGEDTGEEDWMWVDLQQQEAKDGDGYTQLREKQVASRGDTQNRGKPASEETSGDNVERELQQERDDDGENSNGGEEEEEEEEELNAENTDVPLASRRGTQQSGQLATANALAGAGSESHTDDNAQHEHGFQGGDDDGADESAGEGEEELQQNEETNVGSSNNQLPKEEVAPRIETKRSGHLATAKTFAGVAPDSHTVKSDPREFQQEGDDGIGEDEPAGEQEEEDEQNEDDSERDGTIEGEEEDLQQNNRAMEGGGSPQLVVARGNHMNSDADGLAKQKHDDMIRREEQEERAHAKHARHLPHTLL